MSLWSIHCPKWVWLSTFFQTLRNKFPDLAKSLSLPEENALSNLLAKSFNQTLTQEDGETLFSLQNMPRKISLNTRDIGSVSVMNQLITGNGTRKISSNRMSALSDTDESDIDGNICVNNHRTRRFSSNGKNRKKSSNCKEDKLTRSLPHESVTSLTRQTSTVFDMNNTDPGASSSSADPSSSNTTGTNSVAPSSSSDGSVMKTQTSSQLQESSLGKIIAIEILREIKFSYFGVSKTAVLIVLEALILNFGKFQP